MASPAQILANRENAQRSSGPKTVEGKQAAGRNSLRHGLTGAQIVIPGERRVRLRRTSRRCFAPTIP